MAALGRFFRQEGLYTFVRWNTFFTNPPLTITEDELREYCRGQMASCKIPRYIRVVTEFPTTVTGKIQKFRMREISIAELGLSAADAVRTA